MAGLLPTLRVLIAFLLLSEIHGRGAEAQPADAASVAANAHPRAQARVLFKQGIAYSDQQEWAQAADRFQRAYALYESPALAHNLAAAFLELGRLVEASELYRTVARDVEASQRLRTQAQRELDAVLPRLGKLTVQIEGDRRQSEVRVDERVWASASIGLPAPVDPGTHRVAVFRSDRELVYRSVEVAEGGSAEVSLQVPKLELLSTGSTAPATASITAAGALQDSRSVDENDSGGVLSKWWFWAAVGVVVVGATTAGIIAATSGDPDTTLPSGSLGTIDLR